MFIQNYLLSFIYLKTGGWEALWLQRREGFVHVSDDDDGDEDEGFLSSN